LVKVNVKGMEKAMKWHEKGIMKAWKGHGFTKEVVSLGGG
jgi:hypothetical protein